MKTIYFDCFSGASGDMIVAALIDAGANEDTVRGAVVSLPLPIWDLHVESITKGAVRAARLEVACDHDDAHPTTYRGIVSLLENADLEDAVRRRALGAFELLARAEAKIHGTNVDDVHFHEVGALDSIVDVVAACAALEDLAPDRIVVSPIATGRGTTQSQHGPLPVPAPATLELLGGATLYERGDRELITPTGAALLASWADVFGVMPALKLAAIGYGAGTADLPWPNVLRVVIGEQETSDQPEIATELIETNIDDMNPEIVPYVIERLLDAGALDAWAAPATMKKGRTGTVLSTLCESGDVQKLSDILFAETTTLGVRIAPVTRAVLDRKEIEVTVAGRLVRVKVGYRDGAPTTVSPEYEDAAAVARRTGMALRDVYDAARSAARGSL